MITKNDDKTLKTAAAARFEGETGKRFWRSLDEWADTDEFRDMIGRHFPSQMEVAIDPVTRRSFLKVMGASLAFAGMAGCAPRQPDEQIFPYATNVPDGMLPGRPMWFATAMPMGGYGTGLLVESNMGRPTKIEGNKRHPASLGAADVFNQASVLTVYDPDRSQTVMQNGRVSSWDTFMRTIQTERGKHKQNGGVGLRILTGAVTSPTLAAQLRALVSPEQYPAAKWYQYEPVARVGSRVGGRAALGGDFDAVYAFDKAEVILSLDANFIGEGPGHIAYARQYVSGKRVSDGKIELNRLYVVESSPTITGANADNRLRVRPSRIEPVARAIAAGINGGAASDTLDDSARVFVAGVVKDLNAHKGAAVVVAGEYQPPAVHALAHAINQTIGAVGTTVTYKPAAEAAPVDHMASIMELSREIYDGKVDTLVIVGGNPLYDAPVDAFIRENFDRVRLRIHLGQYRDETALQSHWHIPEAHYLESWGDIKAFDGTTSIVQPLIAPLYDGHTSYELIAALLGQGTRSSYDIVREHWMATTLPAGAPPEQFDGIWHQALNDGVVAVPAPAPGAPAPGAPVPAAPRPADIAGAAAFPAAAAVPDDQMEIMFRPDPCVWDGSFANNGWLQELPKPLTKLTWDNAVLMSIRDADRLGVNDEDVVKLTYKDRSVTGPVRVLAGHPKGAITVYLGHGRERGGRVADGVGFNAYTLRTSDAPWFGAGVQIAKTGDKWSLAVTEHHNMISAGSEKREAGSLDDHYSRFNDKIGEGAGYVDGERDRDIFKVATLEEFKSDPLKFKEKEHAVGPEVHPEHVADGSSGATGTGDGGSGPAAVDSMIPGDTNESLLPESFKYDGNRWAMSIDTQSCIGCNACVVACVSENNIPVIGKAQVLMNRQMHWIRVDTYFEGPVDDPNTYFMPVPCQQCENAPCEIVCPVGATVHSEEGLNDMVYNRCVGTRYCSNNCPYKVRRFNFIKYSDQSPLAQLRANPNVTLRARGVMEKCTYCVQRIWKTRITAEKEYRPVRDGEIQTACQQTCPTDAIVFGNLNDPGAQVVKLKRTNLMYGLLVELTTRPRTTYLARVTNPNPEIKKA